MRRLAPRQRVEGAFADLADYVESAIAAAGVVRRLLPDVQVLSFGSRSKSKGG
jgi:hypothetical protein